MTYHQLLDLPVGSVVEFKHTFIWSGGTERKERWQKITKGPEDIWDRIHPTWCQMLQASKPLSLHPCRVVEDLELLATLGENYPVEPISDKAGQQLLDELEIFDILSRAPDEIKGSKLMEFMSHRQPFMRRYERQFFAISATFSFVVSAWIGAWSGGVIGSGLGKYILAWLTQ